MPIARLLRREFVIHYATTLSAAERSLRSQAFHVVLIRSERELTDELVTLLGQHKPADAIALFPLAEATIEQVRQRAPMLRQGRVEDLEELLFARAAGNGTRTEWRSMIVGESSKILEMLAKVELVAPRSCTVLIQGETGSGKELVARAIHQAGNRPHTEMVAVNCAALPPTLLESELFGHTKGAFTGAVAHRVGHFEKASDGTLFLDEIGEMPLELQGKLLRALQEREFFRVGASTPTKMNARILAASNVDLRRAVEQGRFRADLYYRLHVVSIHVPALRERRSDIPLLADHFLRKVCLAEGIPQKMITPEAMENLCRLDWPGNVRELAHLIESVVMLSGDRRMLTPQDFPQLSQPEVAGVEIPESGCNFDELMTQIQRSLLAQALARSGGNKARAAGLLGMKRTTLISKVRALGKSA